MTETIKFTNMQEGLPDEAEVIFKAVDIMKYLGGLAGVISNNSRAVAQAAIGGYSEQEIASHIWRSNENDWQQKPAFFSELCDAYYRIVKSKHS